MPKMSIDPTRHSLSGPTMGTRWQVTYHTQHAAPDPELGQALACAVGRVDGQMSLWQAESDLNRINRAAPDQWLPVPAEMAQVLAMGLMIGQASDGAFDLGMGDAVAAWGFGPGPADGAGIAAARLRPRTPAHQVLELDLENLRLRKHAPLAMDLNGIAKGFGADQLAHVMTQAGIPQALAAIDGELRALSAPPGAEGWAIAVEAPIVGQRSAHSVVTLTDAGIATSGNYRRAVARDGRVYSHTMDPQQGMPLSDAPASVSVIARDCMSADAWATAITVRAGQTGAAAALALAERHGLSALIMMSGGAVQGCGAFRPRALAG